MLIACIKAADVGHPTKRFEVHSQWSNLITLEFFVQGDLEKEYGLTPQTFMDRDQAGTGTLEGHCHFINLICGCLGWVRWWWWWGGGVREKRKRRKRETK